MDINDERRKKLEAGKEKLAAFRKKKAKSKKPTKDSGENLNTKDVEPINGDVNSPSDDFIESSVQQLENALLPSETQSPPVFYQDTSDPEGVAEGNVAPEPIIREVEHVGHEGNTNTNSHYGLVVDSFGEYNLGSNRETSDFQQALAQRDKLIGQLTHSLKSNADQQTEKEELVSQVLTLAQQVTQLQTQLKEADQTLQEQLQLHGISGTALQSAKTQMLQLQSIVHEKDKELVRASQQLEKNHESLCCSKEENTKLSQKLEEKEEELSHLQQCYDSTISSHEEKQEKEESEKSHQLVELQHQWKERECDMSATLESQAKEIDGLKKSEQEWKERESLLQQNYDSLVNRLEQEESGKDERLKTLEMELELLRHQNEKMVEESDSLKRENEQKNSSLFKLETLTEEHDQLSSLHSNMVGDFELLKSKTSGLEESLKQLNLENETTRSELEKLSSELAKEQEKLKLAHENQAELESKLIIDCDRLNNKINELQNTLSSTQESYNILEKDFGKEKEAVGVLQQELSEKESSYNDMSHEMMSISSRNSELQSEVQFKEDQIQELENMLQERADAEQTFKSKGVGIEEEKNKLEESVESLTKELNELRDECEDYIKQISQLQMESSSTVEKVDYLNEELEKKSESLTQESGKCKRLEDQLQMVEEERGILNENITVLNNEIHALKNDLKNERTQIDIIGEELISANSKLVDSHDLMQHNKDEHKSLVEQYGSDIDKLQNEVEKLTHLDSKLVSSGQELDKLNAELKESGESLQAKTEEFEGLKAELETLREGERQSESKIKELEDELTTIRQKYQETAELKQDSLQNQEEMQCQLETTVNQWQKLQLIVQEKEIELQNLHDDLDEQKRICSTMKRNHEEYLDSMKSDVDVLRLEKENKEARVTELEGMMAGLHETLTAKDVELSDTMSKVEAVDTSSQNLALHLSEKEKELDLIMCDKEKFSAELSDKEREITSLKDDIHKADSEIHYLTEELETARGELSTVKLKMEADIEEKDSLLRGLENKNKEISDKDTESASQVASLEAQLADVLNRSNETVAENSNLKSSVIELKSSCMEKDELLSSEAMDKRELQNKLDNEKQLCNRLQGALSFMSQDIESKEELLLMNSSALEEKEAELLQKEQDLIKGSEEVQRFREYFETAKEEMKVNETKLAMTSCDKDIIIDKLQQKDSELNQLTKNREELNTTVENLKGKLKEMETNAEKQLEEKDYLNTQLTCLQDSLDDKDKLLSKEQGKAQSLKEELNTGMQQSLRLKTELSVLSSDVQDRENSLVQQCVLLEEKMDALSNLEIEVSKRDLTIKETKEENTDLVTKMEELLSKESSLETEVTDLREQLDKHEHDLAQMSTENKELSERQTQLEQEVRKQECDIHDMKRDNEILQRESCELKADLQDKENQNLSLMQDVDLMTSAIQTSNGEKEMLKNNFDACLEEVHQKSSAQEIEMGHLKSKIAEESRSRDQGQEEMREMYTQQLAQMEDKLLELGREKSQVEKEIYERDLKLDRLKDDYEQQISEFELSMHSSQSEVTKLKDSISKVNANHDNELTDLKSLHELQMSELMDNYLTLEKSMSEVQKSLTDQAENMKQERNEMEQSFESLMSEMDERKRRSDSDIIRLKKQQDEMLKDHEREMKSLEKKYETHMFDLEDRCSVTSSELERVRKSVVGVEGDFVEERNYLERKIEDLENVRRDLEIKCTILEDDIVLVKEQSNMREDEVKAILKTAAEKQSEMKYEVEDLEEKLRVLRMDNETSSNLMKKELEQRIQDVSAENEHLKNRLKLFERNAELDMEMNGHEKEKEGDDDFRSKFEEMKKQMTALTDENLTLKRRLLGHKSLEKQVRLLSTGVEDIRPPYEESKEEEIILPTKMRMVTSTPSKTDYDYEDDVPFSPTAEEVSLIEGFVSETKAKPVLAHRFGKITPQQSADEEPDFVVEEEDRFQPEMVIEKAVDDFGDREHKRNVHPIQENEITEGFQPEDSDQFFVEISEEHNTWPLELSVGSSPTSKSNPLGFFDENDGVEDNVKQTNAKMLFNETNVLPEQASKLLHEDDEIRNFDEFMEKRVKQMKEDLEEDYAFQLRKQKQDVVLEYEAKYENVEKDFEQHFAQKEQSIKHDWELKFAKAVKKMKKDFEKKLQKQSTNKKGKPQKSESTNPDQGQVTTNQEENDGMSDTEEGNEGLGDVVEQLSKENQELAEVRDELLKEIELSQARGRHSRVQHELQSMLSEREKENDPVSQDISLSSEYDAGVESDILQAETAEPCALSPSSSISVDVQTINSQITEPAERSPTVAAERILEELEDIEQQSSQDLPLEWELTNTIPETGVSLDNAAGHHQSVWEVFGSRCGRQDCLEVRNRYRRLCQCVVTSFGIGEELLSDESGLVQQEGQSSFGEEDQYDGGRKIANNFKGILKLDDNNPDDEDEVDELFADNVALESELLSLAENMVLYKDAFMNKKSELEKENEFLRLEFETESKSRKEEEEKFTNDKEEMSSRIGDLEKQLSCMKSKRKETKTKFSNKAVMTDQESSHDIDLLKSELEEKTDVLKEKQESIQRLQLEMDYFKSQFEEEFDEHKENTESKIKGLEEEIKDLKTENNYLCLTHEGKEETITRLLTDIDHYISEKDNTNETLSGKDSKLLDLDSELTSLAETKDCLQSTLDEKEEEILNLGEEVSKIKSELLDMSKSLASKEIQLEAVKLETSTLKDDNKNLQSALAEKEECIVHTNKDLAQLKAEMEAATNALSEKEDKFEKETAVLDDKVNQLQSYLDEKQIEIDNQNSDVEKITLELEESVKNSSGIIHTLESKVTMLEDENSQLHSNLVQKETVVENLNLEVSQLKCNVEAKDEEISNKDSTIEILGCELVQKEEGNASLQAVGSKCTTMVKSLELELTEMNIGMANLKQENDRLHTELEEQHVCIGSSTDTLKMLEEKVSNLQDENNNLLSDIETKTESLSKSQSKIDDLTCQLEDLKQENHRFSTKVEEQQQELCQHTLAGENTLRMLEEEVSSLREDNNKLHSIIEGKNESLSKSELRIDSLGSELQELSVRLDNLQKENDTLKTLQHEVCDLKDQNGILLEDQKEKCDMIVYLNEEIDKLKAQLLDFEKKVEEFNFQSKLSKPIEEVIVSECNFGSESSVVKSNESSSLESNTVQDAIIPVQSSVTEQQATNMISKEVDSDVRSSTSSQAHTEDSVVEDVFESTTSPLFVSSSSIPADGSVVSSTSVDQSSVVSPAELQDQALAEELNQLKKDLRETKALYSKENSLLHEALEREKRVKDYVMNKNDVEPSLCASSSEGENQQPQSSNPDTDMGQRLAVCLEQNKMLEEENGKLRTKIRKQEAVVLIYKHRLSEKEHDSELWRKSLTGQLQALQKQRDDMVQLLRNQEMGLSSSCPTISEAIGQAALKEESLRRVQDDLMEKMEELDHLHQMLTQRQVELQHCDMERRHLEQLCVLKDQTEMQLMKQKRLMEEQVCEIEHRLKEREGMLSEEKSKLMEELKEKDDQLLQMSQPQSPRSPHSSISSPNRSYSMGDLSSSVGATSFKVDLNSSADEADEQHLKAIETLREKLRLEYSVRSSRLAESQASAVASYWMRRQSSNSKDGSQNFDS